MKKTITTFALGLGVLLVLVPALTLADTGSVSDVVTKLQAVHSFSYTATISGELGSISATGIIDVTNGASPSSSLHFEFDRMLYQDNKKHHMTGDLITIGGMEYERLAIAGLAKQYDYGYNNVWVQFDPKHFDPSMFGFLGETAQGIYAQADMISRIALAAVSTLPKVALTPHLFDFTKVSGAKTVLGVSTTQYHVAIDSIVAGQYIANHPQENLSYFGSPNPALVLAQLKEMNPTMDVWIATKTRLPNKIQLQTCADATRCASMKVKAVLTFSQINKSFGLTAPKKFQSALDIFKANTTFIGVGISLGKYPDGTLFANGVVPGSPAEKAGILGQDTIVSIDGKNPQPMTVDEASTLLKGTINTPVVLGVRRYGTGQVMMITLLRAQIVVPIPAEYQQLLKQLPTF